jgi:hypothetical protein
MSRNSGNVTTELRLDIAIDIADQIAPSGWLMNGCGAVPIREMAGRRHGLLCRGRLVEQLVETLDIVSQYPSHPTNGPRYFSPLRDDAVGARAGSLLIRDPQREGVGM